MSRRFALLDPDSSPACDALGACAMVAALGTGLLGQLWLDRHPTSIWAWAPLVLGAAGLGLLARSMPLERLRAEPAAANPARRTHLAAAVGLAVLAFPGFGGNLFRPAPTLMWLASLVLLYLAFADRPFPRLATLAPRARLGTIHLSWHALALLAILLVAAFLRLYRLDAIPAEMGTDMPLKYENAREILQGQLMIFCPRFPGREALFHYLVAAYGALFGLSYFAIKFTSAMVGLVSVVALYALARELYGRQVALCAAALLALSRWHVTLSRSGYRASLMPLMVAGLLYLLARALRRGRGSDWVLAGMALGLGLYTYNAFMIVPLVAAMALAIELARMGKGSLRRHGWGLAGLALGALGVFLPLARYALEAPQSYLFRVATRVTGVETPLPQGLLQVFAGNLLRAAGMFNLRGDIVFYINVPGLRELGLVSGTLFLCGLAYALLRLRRGHHAMVLVFLAGMLLPTALAIAFPREVPNAVRASGALTPAYLLAALPLAALWQQLRRGWTGSLQPLASLVTRLPAGVHRIGGALQTRLAAGVAAAAIVAALLGLELAETRQAYFEDYVRHLPGNNYALSLEMARTLDDFAAEGVGYVKVWPHWYDGNAVRVQLTARGQDWELQELDPARPPLAATGKVLCIVHPQDREALQLLRAAFVNGVAVGHRDNEGRVAFIAFYGER